MDEFIQLMSKFGIIMRDPQTEEFKVKLYKDNQGNLKGDGLCCYLKRESVELALKLLDEDEIRGYKLHVEVAKFQLKGNMMPQRRRRSAKTIRRSCLCNKSSWIGDLRGELDHPGCAMNELSSSKICFILWILRMILWC